MSSESKVRVGFYQELCCESFRIPIKGVIDPLDVMRIVNGENPSNVADTSGDANSTGNIQHFMISEEKANKIMAALINGAIRDENKPYNTTREMWLKLEEILESKAPDMKILFMKKLLSFKMNDGQDVSIHVQEFCDTVDKLTKMEVAINEHFLCTLLLKSLPNSFQSFRREMESMDEFPSLEDLARKIIEEGIKMDSTTPNAPEDELFGPVGYSISHLFKRLDDRTYWLLDTKLPYHCCDEALLPRITPAVRADYVIKEGPDWILNSGTLNICSQYPDRSITIHDILCVQGFDMNILSVSRITEMGYEVIFESKIARIVDKQGRTILTAYKDGDSYWIIENLFKQGRLPYYEAKPPGKIAGIFNCLTEWLGLSSRY